MASSIIFSTPTTISTLCMSNALLTLMKLSFLFLFLLLSKHCHVISLLIRFEQSCIALLLHSLCMHCLRPWIRWCSLGMPIEASMCVYALVGLGLREVNVCMHVPMCEWSVCVWVCAWLRESEQAVVCVSYSLLGGKLPRLSYRPAPLLRKGITSLWLLSKLCFHVY